MFLVRIQFNGLRGESLLESLWDVDLGEDIDTVALEWDSLEDLLCFFMVTLFFLGHDLRETGVDRNTEFLGTATGVESSALAEKPRDLFSILPEKILNVFSFLRVALLARTSISLKRHWAATISPVPWRREDRLRFDRRSRGVSLPLLFRRHSASLVLGWNHGRERCPCQQRSSLSAVSCRRTLLLIRSPSFRLER